MLHDLVFIVGLKLRHMKCCVHDQMQPTLCFTSAFVCSLFLPQVDELNTKSVSVNNSFAIYGQNRTLVVAASSPDEKLKWLEDLHSAIFLARGKQDDVKVLYPSLKSTSGFSY